MIRYSLAIPFLILFMGALLFIPAGTVNWMEGWIYILILVVYYILMTFYFIIKDPATLKKRRKLSSSKMENTALIIFGFFFLLVMILPGFDYQFQWTQLPNIIKIFGFSGLVITYLLNFWVMKMNSFASKGLMTHEDQVVIMTGPYKHVRHPMYVSFILLAFSTPIALGSLVSLVLAPFIPFFLVFRIQNEEKMLKKELIGYIDYIKKVPYRLIPKIW